MPKSFATLYGQFNVSSCHFVVVKVDAMREGQLDPGDLLQHGTRVAVLFTSPEESLSGF
jgi:hypothetical protein